MMLVQDRFELAPQFIVVLMEKRWKAAKVKDPSAITDPLARIPVWLILVGQTGADKKAE